MTSPQDPTADAAADPAQAPDEEQPPLLRVVRGDPTPEQLAALVAVTAALAAGQAPAPTGPRTEWSAPHRLVRRPDLVGHRHAPGAWRASAR